MAVYAFWSFGRHHAPNAIGGKVHRLKKKSTSRKRSSTVPARALLEEHRHRAEVELDDLAGRGSRILRARRNCQPKHQRKILKEMTSILKQMRMYMELIAEIASYLGMALPDMTPRNEAEVVHES